MTRAADAQLTPEELAAKRRHELAMEELRLRQTVSNNRHGRVLALVWAPVCALVVLGLFALIGEAVRDVTNEHLRKVDVWCYADPNTTNATSEFHGVRSAVEGICPDAKRPAPEPTYTYGGSGNP